MRFSILLFLVSFTAMSQNCEETLSGFVIDFHDNSRLAGATLVIAGLEVYAQTDLDGYFSFENLCPGRYNIQVSHPECETKLVIAQVPYPDSFTIRMEHHLEELDHITVKGSAAISHISSQQEKRVEKSEIEALSYASLGDALKLLSGVSSLNTGSTVVKPVIQGLHSSRVVIMNHGVRMQDQEWGAEHAPNVDLNTAGSISLIKGASALQFGGDAVGGIVLVEPQRIIRKDSLYGSTLLTGATNGRGGSISTVLSNTYENGWYGSAQGTLKRFGDFEAPRYVLSNSGMFERDASLRVGLNKFKYGFDAYYSYFHNEVGILSASHLGGAEDQVRAISSSEPLVINDFTYTIGNPKQEVTHHLAKLKVFRRFTGFGKLEAQYDFQYNNRLEYDIRRGGRSDIPSVDLGLTTHNLTTDLSYDANADFKAAAGIMLRYQNNFSNPDTGVRRLIPDYDKYDAGVYASGKYSLSPDFLIEAGLRYDYNHMDSKKYYRKSLWEGRGYDTEFADIVIGDFGNQVLVNPELTFHNFSATAGFSYDFSEKYRLLFNYSLATRAPNPSELFSEGLHHSAARIEIGDLRFNQEVANKFSLALERESEKFYFSVNPYINDIRDFLLIEPRGVEQTIRGNFQVWEFRQADALLMGVDVDARVAMTDRLTFINRFSIVKGYDKNSDDPLINMPPANLSNTLQYEMEKWNNLKLSLESNYVFRQNEFPDTNFDIFLPTTETFETVDVSTPPGAYHLLHLNADMKFQVWEGSQLNMGLTVNNILNTEYRDYLNRLRYYADDLGRNIVLRLKINY